MPPGEPVGATLLGTNYGTGNTTADAQADVANVHAQLMGLDATPIAAELAGVTLGPGVYSSATFLLAAGVLTFVRSGVVKKKPLSSHFTRAP